MSYYNNDKFGDSEDWKKPFFEFNTLEKLEKLNARGPDEDLEVSLFAYGFVWFKNGSEYTFVFGAYCDEHNRFFKFRYATLDRKKTDFFRKYRYLNWDKFFQHYNTNFHDWPKKWFPLKVYDVYCFFGGCNTFFTRKPTWDEEFVVKLT